MLDLSNPRVLETINKAGSGVRMNSHDQEILRELSYHPYLSPEEREASRRYAEGRKDSRTCEILANLKKRLICPTASK